MSVYNNSTKRKKRGRLRGVIASALSLCVLGGLALLLIPGGPGPGLSGIGRWLSGDTELTGEFYFSGGTNKVYADLGGGIAAAGELGIQVLGDKGEERFREQVLLKEPVIEAAGGRAVVYDLGASALRVIDSGGVISSLEAAGPIVAASINEKGWYCVVAQESAVKSIVTVYSSKGSPKYQVEMYSGYVLDARLSRDNKNLAVLSITDTGGRVQLYSLDSDEVRESYERAGEVILAVSWLPDGRLIAVTDKALLLLDKNGEGSEVYGFRGRQLSGMCLSGGDFIALYLLDYGVGSEGRLVTLDYDGSILRELTVGAENKGMSICGGTLAVLWDTGVSRYDRELSETKLTGEGKALTGVLVLSGEKVFTISPRVSRVTD